MSNPFEEMVDFDSVDGRSFKLIKYVSPRMLHAWLHKNPSEYVLGKLDIGDVSVDMLKQIDIWKEIPSNIQKELESKIIQQVEDVSSKMEKARAGRRARYKDVPREVVCASCGKTFPIAPGSIVKKVDMLVASGVIINIPEYVSQWKCQKCNPTKGRKKNPELANVPAELVCNKCKTVKACPPSSIAQRAKLKGITIQKFLDTYVCQVCNPTKGRGRKRRKK